MFVTELNTENYLYVYTEAAWFMTVRVERELWVESWTYLLWQALVTVLAERNVNLNCNWLLSCMSFRLYVDTAEKFVKIYFPPLSLNCMNCFMATCLLLYGYPLKSRLLLYGYPPDLPAVVWIPALSSCFCMAIGYPPVSPCFCMATHLYLHVSSVLSACISLLLHSYRHVSSWCCMDTRQYLPAVAWIPASISPLLYGYPPVSPCCWMVFRQCLPAVVWILARSPCCCMDTRLYVPVFAWLSTCISLFFHG